jgi:hypothetical protein
MNERYTPGMNVVDQLDVFFGSSGSACTIKRSKDQAMSGDEQ